METSRRGNTLDSTWMWVAEASVGGVCSSKREGWHSFFFPLEELTHSFKTDSWELEAIMLAVTGIGCVSLEGKENVPNAEAFSPAWRKGGETSLPWSRADRNLLASHCPWEPPAQPSPVLPCPLLAGAYLGAWRLVACFFMLLLHLQTKSFHTSHLS